MCFDANKEPLFLRVYVIVGAYGNFYLFITLLL